MKAMVHVSFRLDVPPKPKRVTVTVVESLRCNKHQDDPVPVAFGTNPKSVCGCTPQVPSTSIPPVQQLLFALRLFSALSCGQAK